MRTFKFLSYKKDFHTITTGDNLFHEFDMDKVCLLFLKRCYAMNWNFQTSYPINFLNTPINNHFITIHRMERILNPFGDFIVIYYKIVEVNNSFPYEFRFEIPMRDFELAMTE